jgi:Ni2+-binding GTPase involved in maturation of urease and hydrogenase
MIEIIIKGPINSGKSSLVKMIIDTIKALKVNTVVSKEDIEDMPSPQQSMEIIKAIPCIKISTLTIGRDKK